MMHSKRYKAPCYYCFLEVVEETKDVIYAAAANPFRVGSCRRHRSTEGKEPRKKKERKGPLGKIRESHPRRPRFSTKHFVGYLKSRLDPLHTENNKKKKKIGIAHQEPNFRQMSQMVLIS